MINKCCTIQYKTAYNNNKKRPVISRMKEEEFKQKLLNNNSHKLFLHVINTF